MGPFRFVKRQDFASEILANTLDQIGRRLKPNKRQTFVRRGGLNKTYRVNSPPFD